MWCRPNINLNEVIKQIKQKENISGDLIYHQDLSYVKYHNEVTYPLIWKYGDVYKMLFSIL